MSTPMRAACAYFRNTVPPPDRCHYAVLVAHAIDNNMVYLCERFCPSNLWMGFELCVNAIDNGDRTTMAYAARHFNFKRRWDEYSIVIEKLLARSEVDLLKECLPWGTSYMSDIMLRDTVADSTVKKVIECVDSSWSSDVINNLSYSLGVEFKRLQGKAEWFAFYGIIDRPYFKYGYQIFCKDTPNVSFLEASKAANLCDAAPNWDAIIQTKNRHLFKIALRKRNHIHPASPEQLRQAGINGLYF